VLRRKEGPADAGKAGEPESFPRKQAISPHDGHSRDTTEVAIIEAKAEAYAGGHTSRPSELLERLWDETHRSLEWPGMLTGPVEGRLLQTLVFATGARRILEIGTYSGYSALWMAEGMPPDGKIITCEIDPRHAQFAGEFIAATPYAGMIEIRLGPALDTIAKLDGSFDFVFIDADKERYPEYLEAVFPMLAPRGIIAADNTLWSGRVYSEEDSDPATIALRRFNDMVASDPRMVAVMLTVRDGLTLIRRA
jgi:caffeoyl-CoA O-methyltransferase